MLHANGKRTCDHEMGSPVRGWHACNANAAYRITSTYGELHACNAHANAMSVPAGKVPSWRLVDMRPVTL